MATELEQRIITGDFLSDVIDAFIISRKVENCAPGTVKFYAHKLLIFYKFCVSQNIECVPQIDATLLRNYFLYFQQSHNPGGVHAMYRTLRTLFNWYEDEAGYPSPMKKLKPPRVDLPPLAPADSGNIAKMISYCSARDKAIILVLLDTGVRASELLSIRVEDINILTGEIIIRRGKGGKPRSVFIGKATRKALRAILTSHSGILFDLSYTGLRMMLKRRCKDAHVDYISPHQFRRTFAITMLREGADIFSISRLMGHADLQVLQRYLKQTNEDLRIAHDRASPADKLKA